MNIPIHGQSQDAYSFQDQSAFQPSWNQSQQYQQYNGDYYQNQPLPSQLNWNQPLLQQPVWNQSLAPQDIYQTQYYGYQQPVPMNQPIVAKESEDFQFPSIIMTGLAALNARRPISTQDAYSFIKKHWPRFRYGTSKWKNNIRHKLTDRPFFTKVAGISMLKSLYVFNKENPGWLEREIERMERRRIAQGLSLDCYGLEDTSVWQSMVAGNLGLPPFVSSDARLSSVRKPKAPKAVPRNVQQQNQMAYPNQQYFYPPAVQGPLMQ